MNKNIFISVIINNLILFVIDFAILFLILRGVFNPLFSSNVSGTAFYIPLAPIIFWRILVFLISIFVIYKRFSKTKIKIENLSVYYFLSLLGQLLVTSVTFFLVPAFNPFVVVIIAIFVYVLLSIGISSFCYYYKKSKNE